MTPEDLMNYAANEFLAKDGKDVFIPLHLDLQTAILMVGMLQLALRHPEHTHSESGDVIRGIVGAMISRMRQMGFPFCAAIAAAGDNPKYDT
jgi:hypothetical protein